MTKLPRILLILFGLVLIGNLLFLDYSVFLKEPSDSGLNKRLNTSEVSPYFPTSDTTPGVFAEFTPGVSSSGTCGSECQSLIAEEVSRAVATISGQETVPEKVVQPTSSPQTFYLPLGGGGSTTATGWTSLGGSEFIFDLADYGRQTEVYWQGNLKAEHANSRCYARIYDDSHKRAVDYSEQTTNETSFQLLTSLKLSVWQGKNNYYLQFKSLNGISCFLESPRLIIINK